MCLDYLDQNKTWFVLIIDFIHPSSMPLMDDDVYIRVNYTRVKRLDERNENVLGTL